MLEKCGEVNPLLGTEPLVCPTRLWGLPGWPWRRSQRRQLQRDRRSGGRELPSRGWLHAPIIFHWVPGCLVVLVVSPLFWGRVPLLETQLNRKRIPVFPMANAYQKKTRPSTCHRVLDTELAFGMASVRLLRRDPEFKGNGEHPAQQVQSKHRRSPRPLWALGSGYPKDMFH